MPAHSGSGEEVAFIDIASNETGQCVAGLYNAALNIAVAIRFQKKELPWFTNWQHWGKGEYVTGMEPGTHPPIGQAAARARKELIFLQPGETRKYNIEIEVIKEGAAIAQLLRKTHLQSNNAS